MPKVIEIETEKPRWLQDFLNRAALDTDTLRTRAVSWGAGTADAPDYRALRVLGAPSWVEPEHDDSNPRNPGFQSLYYNGIVFQRLVFGERWWHFGWWLQLKWSRNTQLQLGFGYKINGRLGGNLRYQTDESAARGTTGPNSGQAAGWAWGTA